MPSARSVPTSLSESTWFFGQPSVSTKNVRRRPGMAQRLPVGVSRLRTLARPADQSSWCRPQRRDGVAHGAGSSDDGRGGRLLRHRGAALEWRDHVRHERSPRWSTSPSARGSASSASWPACSCATTDRPPRAPGTVILKIPSQYPENRAVADHFNFYEREGRFYQLLADKVPVRTAQLLLEPDRRGRRRVRAAARGPRRPHDDQPDRRHPRRAGGQRAARPRPHPRRLVGVDRRSTASTGCRASTIPINLAAGQQYRDAWPLFVERIEDALPDGAARGRRTGADHLRGPAARRDGRGTYRGLPRRLPRRQPHVRRPRPPGPPRRRGRGARLADRLPRARRHRRRLLPLPVAHRRRAPHPRARRWSRPGTRSCAETARREVGRGARRLPVRAGLDAVPASRRWARPSTRSPPWAPMDPANERGRELCTAMAGARLHRRPRPRRASPLLTR